MFIFFFPKFSAKKKLRKYLLGSFLIMRLYIAIFCYQIYLELKTIYIVYCLCDLGEIILNFFFLACIMDIISLIFQDDYEN